MADVVSVQVEALRLASIRKKTVTAGSRRSRPVRSTSRALRQVFSNRNSILNDRVTSRDSHCSMLGGASFPGPRQAHHVTITGRGKKINGAASAMGATTTLTGGNTRILIVSVSPRNGTSATLNMSRTSKRPSICSIVRKHSSLNSIVAIYPSFPALSIIPTSVSLDNTRLRITSLPGQGALLGRTLSLCLHRSSGRCSCIFVSYPPDLNLLIVGTVYTIARVLVPVRTRCCTLRNLNRLVGAVNLIRRRFGPMLLISAVLIAVFSHQALLDHRMCGRIGKRCPDVILGAAVPHSIGVSRTPDFSRSIVTCSPHNVNTVSCNRTTLRVTRHSRRILSAVSTEEGGW